MGCAKSLHIWLFKVIHSKMVRWVETDGQGLAAAAAGCIYRYYHPACNAGDLRWKHDIMLPRGYDITSKMNTDMIKTLRLLAKHYFSCSFLVTGKVQLPPREVRCRVVFVNRVQGTAPGSLQPACFSAATYGFYLFWQADYRAHKLAVFTQPQQRRQ